MPEITLKKNTIYLNKVFQDWDRPSNLFIYKKKKTSISVQGQEASRYGRGKAACCPRNPISSVLSLRSRRLKVVGARKNGYLRVSPSLAPVLSCAHYFQAPATQATVLVTSDVLVYKNLCLLKCHLFSRRCIVEYIQSNLMNFVAWIEKNNLKYRHPKCH